MPSSSPAAAPIVDPDETDAAWRARLSVPAVDRSSIRWRLDTLWSRSVKADTQVALVDLALACTDLTSLESPDTPARVARLVHKAARPDPADLSCPRPAAVCVWGDLAADARVLLDVVADSGPAVQLAVVAGAFPSSRSHTAIKVAEVAAARDDGADEIDVVLDRGLFLAGRYQDCYRELVALRAAVGPAHLKVILETGELGTLTDVAAAAELALCAGADFVKTSTGKASVNATPESVWVLCQAVARFAERTGEVRGVKAAGGIRSAKDAVRYLLVAHDVAGADWCHPDRWRFGASGLVDDLCAQRRHLATGRYVGPRYFPVA